MIEVAYSCDRCGAKKVPVQIVERSPREDVVQFMERAAQQCSADHDSRSPDCEISEFTEFFVPTYDDVPIGQQPRKQ